MHGCLYSLSRLSIRELPIKNSLDFRGESILTPPPSLMPPLHNIHLVMVMVAVKLKLSYTLGPKLPELSSLCTSIEDASVIKQGLHGQLANNMIYDDQSTS